MADAENKGSGSGGQDIGRNETEEIAVVVLHFYTHYYGNHKSDKSKDIDNMAEAFELRGFLFIVEKGLDIVGIYSTACKVDENHFIEIDRESCKMTNELIAHSSQPHYGEIFQYGLILGYIPEDGDGKIDTDNHAEIPEMTFLLAKGVKGIVVYDAIEERPKDKSREYAEDILGIECFELYLLQGVEHKETC